MLLIDSGNSAVKTRHLRTDNCDDRVFPLHNGFRQSGFVDYLSSLSELNVFAASVASEQVQETLQAMIRQHLPGADFQQLHTLAELDGVTNAYTDYRQLGVDRWLTLLAASELTRQDVIIVDAGSAITIDLLSRQHGHLGGAILPGFNTSLERFQSLFPLVDFDDAEIEQTEHPGTSTAACINIKQIPVAPLMVIAIVERWLALLLPPVEILLTGQDARRIGEQMTSPYQVRTDLVFTGMLKQIQCLG